MKGQQLNTKELLSINCEMSK